jgi:hypothetical protein
MMPTNERKSRWMASPQESGRIDKSTDASEAIVERETSMVMRIAPEDGSWKMLIRVRRISGLALLDLQFF